MAKGKNEAHISGPTDDGDDTTLGHAYTYTRIYTKGRISSGVTTVRWTPDRLPLARAASRPRTIKLSHDPYVERNKY